MQTDLFTLGLGFPMLSMGLTLTFDDFGRCLQNPWTVRYQLILWFCIWKTASIVSCAIMLVVDIEYFWWCSTTRLTHTLCFLWRWVCFFSIVPYQTTSTICNCLTKLITNYKLLIINSKLFNMYCNNGGLNSIFHMESHPMQLFVKIHF